ncbi:MAG: hypothetical protein IPM47_15075 [Sphingobacteriales bacterium]|nr:MAG: hypothetical protein IPM47_15075 [Sphingobacteriales bacterium]
MKEENTPTDKNSETERSFRKLLIELKPVFGRKPNLQSLLFLIGVQELGQLHREFSKEEKQDLMHLAVCRLLSQCGYFSLEYIDEEGWPHYKSEKAIPENIKGLAQQEHLLKEQILIYFGKTSGKLAGN